MDSLPTKPEELYHPRSMLTRSQSSSVNPPVLSLPSPACQGVTPMARLLSVRPGLFKDIGVEAVDGGFRPIRQKMDTLHGPSLGWDQRDRLVVVLIDQSGSMADIVHPIRDAVKAEAATWLGGGVAVHYIAFSVVATDAVSIDSIPYSGGGTDIASAFRLLSKLLAHHGSPRRLDIVFVSDGQDPGCVSAMALLPPLPCPSTFLCVGVRSGFPTTLALGTLAKYAAKANDPTSTLVFPLEFQGDALSVMRQVSEEVFAPSPRPIPTVADLEDPTISIDGIYEVAKRAYNICMFRVFVGLERYDDGRNEERAAALKECFGILDPAWRMVQARIKDAKQAVGKASVGKVLPAEEHGSPQALLAKILAFNSRLREFEDLMARNVVMDDNSKRLMVGLAGRFGKLTVKASTYFGADFNLVMPRFIEAVRGFEATDDDRLLRSSHGSLVTQADHLAVARNNVDEIAKHQTIQDIMSEVPMVGRALTIARLTEGCVMCPWNLEVLGAPARKFITTTELLFGSPNLSSLDNVEDVNAYEAGFRLACADPWSDVYGTFPWLRVEGRVAGAEVPAWDVRRGRSVPLDVVNHILLLPNSVLVPGEDGAIGMGHYMSTFALTRNPSVYHPDAWMGTLAAWVVYLLSGSYKDSWEEMLEASGTFMLVYPRMNVTKTCGMYEYLDGLRGDKFRRCLATEVEGQKALRCPHLTKYVFGLFLLAMGKDVDRALVADRLSSYYAALLVELFHRMKVPLVVTGAISASGSQWADDNFVLPSPAELAGRYVSLKSARAGLCRKFDEVLCKTPLRDLGFMPEIASDTVRAALGGAHFQFSVDSVDRMFETLADILHVPAPMSVRKQPLLLARVLRIASSTHNNRDRCYAPSFDEPATEKDMEHWGGGMAVATFRRDAHARFAERLAEAFSEGSRIVHAGVARGFPKEHVRRFMAEEGVNLEEEFCLTESGLSATSCCFKGCPHYLVRIGEATGDGSGRGKWALSGELRSHLHPLGDIVPGMHKKIEVARQIGGGSVALGDDGAVCDAVVSMVLGADTLVTAPFPGKPMGPYVDRLQARVDRSVSSVASARALVTEAVREQDGWGYDDFRATMLVALGRGGLARSVE